jgi:hypothetical protein
LKISRAPFIRSCTRTASGRRGYLKLVTIGDGGKMAEARAQGLLDFCPTAPTSGIHRGREAHVALYHIMLDLVHTFLRCRSLLEDGNAGGRDEIH